MTPEEPRLSNSRDYDITTGLRCPHCSNDDKRLIERTWAGWYCTVCGRTWPAVPAKYRG